MDKNVEIEGTCRSDVEFDKRFYIPGVKVKSTCPNCLLPHTQNMGDNYLSYPSAGVPIKLGFWCSECEHEWSVKVVLKISLEAAEE